MCGFLLVLPRFLGPYASIFTASVEDAGEAKAETSQIAEQLVILEKLKKQFRRSNQYFSLTITIKMIFRLSTRHEVLKI